MEQKKRVAFLTLGCKTNQYETNGMMQKFIEAGYEICDLNDNPDIYVVNTCTVTNIADRKSRQSLRRIKDKNNTIIVAVGCYAQVAKEKLEQMPEIDIVLGNSEKKDIVQYIENFLKNTTTDSGKQKFTTISSGEQRFTTTDSGEHEFTTTNGGKHNFTTISSGKQKSADKEQARNVCEKKYRSKMHSSW